MIQISEDPNIWKMNYSSEEVVAKLIENKVPQPLVQIAAQTAPRSLSMFEEVSPNSLWPLQEDFIPIWTSNGTSCLAYEPSTGNYHYQHIEDIIEEEPEIFESYENLCDWLINDQYQSIDQDRKEAIKTFMKEKN